MRIVATKGHFLVTLGLLLAAGARPAGADLIDFENLTGPTTFAAAGDAQTLTIGTSHGDVKISGGVILTNVTNLPADETSIYGAAGNASNIGVTTGSGFTNPITITFPFAVTGFTLDLLNGNTQDVTYELADNAGNSATFDLAPNLSSGTKTIGFGSAGNIITVTATTGQSTPSGITFDFFIDNIHFNAVPEPSSLALCASAGVTLLVFARLRRTRE